MNQKEIVKKLKKSAKIYKENLQNTNLLIIYNKNKKIEYIEILFLARNFMHLTGVRSLDSKTYYIPNTLLKKDIRKLTLKQYPIICILKKKINEEKYQMVTYISKKIDIDKVEKNIELCNKINIKILDKVVNLK